MADAANETPTRFVEPAEGTRTAVPQPKLDELSAQAIGAAFDTGCDQKTGGHRPPPCEACEGIRRRVVDLVRALRDTEESRRRQAASNALRARVEAQAEWRRTLTALQAAVAALERVRQDVRLPLDDAGLILHVAWEGERRRRGHHYPTECPHYEAWAGLKDKAGPLGALCQLCDMHLLPWAALPDESRATNRVMADRLLAAVLEHVQVPAAARVDTTKRAVDVILDELRPKKAEAPPDA